MATPYPDAAAAADLNLLASFLARRDVDPNTLTPESFDVIVLCGSAVLSTLDVCVGLLAQGVAPRLLCAGGVGHSTPLLYAAVAADPALGGLAVDPPAAEGAVLRAAALALGAPPGAVFAETLSANCGANAREARRYAEAAGWAISR